MSHRDPAAAPGDPLRTRLVLLTTRRVASAMPVHVLGALMLLPLLRSPSDLGVLAWVAAISMLAVVIGLLARDTREVGPATTQLLVVGGALLGLAWGLGYHALAPDQPPARQTGILVLVILIGATAVPVLSALRTASSLHVLGILGPVAVTHLVGDLPGEIDLGLMVLALAAALVLIMGRVRRILERSVSSSLEKARLTEELNREVVRQRLSERYYRGLLENSSDLINVLAPDGEVLFESESAHELVGEGSSSGEPVRSAMDRVHTEDRPRIRAAHRELLDQGSEDVRFEYRLKDRQGRWRRMAAAARLLSEGRVPDSMVLSSRDITERSRIATELAKQHGLLTSLIAAAADPIFYKSLDGAYLGCNAAYARLVGREPDELVGLTDADLHPLELAARARERDQVVISGGEVVRHDDWIDAPGGRRVLLNTAKAPFRDAEGRIAGIVGVCRDITEQKHLEDQLRAQAVTDGLTGLMNRRRLDEVVGEEWARAQRQGTPVSLLMLDIDHFKAFNDHYGHPEGDAVLVQVGQLLTRAVQRPGDAVARYGGEEFTMVLPFTGENGAMTIAEKVQELVAEAGIANTASPIGPRLTLSIGVATGRPSRERDQPAADLLEAADRALYDAKQAGRNAIRHQDPATG